MGENFRKILIIDLAYIGDLLMATPAISEIKKHYPGADITVLCSGTSAHVLLRNPSIDDIITMDKKKAGGLAPFHMAPILRTKGFDAAFVFHRAFGSALMAFLAGIRTRIGFSTEGRGWLLTNRLRLDTSRHRSDNDLALLESFGLDVDFNAPLVFNTDPADERFPEETLGEDVVAKGYFVINPNGSWETKRWPVERFCQLTARLAADFDLTPVGIGSESERDRVDEALGGLGVNLAGRTDFSKLGVLCRKAGVVITNDSGPMHIAAAVGARLVALFGPTSPDRCGPRSDRAVVISQSGLDCLGCYKKQCPIDFPCMMGIDVDKVYNTVRSILS